ncbi:MAG: ATP-binding protein [Verrucomicrobiota bacterium]|nr:ATP-binding protein [Verrucomicrobiota bacterium]
MAFGLPGRGKTRLCCAIARELIVAKGYRALFCPAVLLVQQLLVAKRDPQLESALRKLDGYDILFPEVNPRRHG